MRLSVLDYDREAERYDDTRGGLKRAGNAAAAVRGFLPAGAARVLDVGGGTGSVGAALTGLDVVCLDASEGMLRRAAERLPGRCVRGSGDHLPFGPARFDAVTFVWLLHLVPDAGPLLVEAARVLRPGGRVITTVDKNSAHRETDSDIGAVLRAQLEPAAEAVDRLDRIVGLALKLGLSPAGTTTFVGVGQALTPRTAERLLERAHLDPDQLAAGLAALRALPDPDRLRVAPTYRLLALAP